MTQEKDFDLHQKTIPFMWVAFYSDKTCLPEFELDNSEGHELGREHHFKEIDLNRLVKFGLFPIPKNLADKLGGSFYHDPSLLRIGPLKLKPNQRLIGGIRRESQTMYEYSKCLKCGFEWQWMMGKEDGSIGLAGLPRYGSEKTYFYLVNKAGEKVYDVICPKCGARNDLECPDCHLPFNKVETEDSRGKPVEQRKYRIECPKCKKIREIRTAFLGGYQIKEVYLLGYQETLPDGSNHKCIMFINNDGSFEMSDDFNGDSMTG